MFLIMTIAAAAAAAVDVLTVKDNVSENYKNTTTSNNQRRNPGRS